MSAEAKQETTFEYFAGMSCDGCKNAITRILTKMAGVTKVEADVPNKKVLVTGTVSSDEITAALEKWAKAAKKELRFVGVAA